ncbi:MAG: response regulator [Phycisphaerales bacterium]
MPLSELEALVADPRLAAAGLREVAERGARACALAAACDGCEVWIWRSSTAGDRALERIAVFGPQLAASPLDALTEALAPIGVPQPSRTDDGHAVACMALGVHGVLVLVRRNSAAAPETEPLAALGARFGELLAGQLPRAELEASNRWLLTRNELDRRAATALAGVRTVDELGRLIESLAEELFPIEYSGIYFVDPGTGRLKLVYAKGLTEAERRSAERTAEQRHPGQVIRTGLPIDVEDTEVARDPSEPPGHGRPVRSRVYLPVRLGGAVVGAIGFASSRPASFGGRHRQVLAFLADLAGLTYARLQAKAETERRGQLIEATATANERLLSAIDWRHAATAALALVGGVMHAATLALVRIERVEAAEQVDFAWQPIFGSPWANRARVARPDAAHAARLARGEAVELAGEDALPAVLLKPVLVEGQLWGVIAFEPRAATAGEHGAADGARGIGLSRAERSALRGLASGFSSAIARERVDLELRERQKLDAVSRLASGIAHDFNNLLWPVLLYSEILERGQGVDERSRQMLRDMRRAAARASELVQQVFAISRSRDRVLQVINVAEMAVEISVTVRRSAPGSVAIAASIDADAGHVLGTEQGVREVLVGIFAHALDALRGAGAMRIELDRVERDRGAWIRVAAIDDGPPPREDALDLAAVRRAAVELGGQFTLRAASPAGTMRELLLPVALRESPRTERSAMTEPAGARPDAPMHARTDAAGTETAADSAPMPMRSATMPMRSAPAPASPAPSERILLVDDDAAVLEVARQILESLGYAVTPCGDPRRALGVLEDGSVRLALLLTDLAMPGMDGMTLAREARRLRPALPIVCCTGFGDARAERAAQEIGVAAFIRKPIDFDHYATTIRAAIDGPRRG